MRKINLNIRNSSESRIIIKNEDGTTTEIYDDNFTLPDRKIVYSAFEQQQIDYVNKQLTGNLHETLTNGEIVFLLNPLSGKHTEADTIDELQKLSGFVVHKEITMFDDLNSSHKTSEPPVEKSLDRDERFIETAEETVALDSLQLLIDTRDALLSGDLTHDQDTIDTFNEKIDTMQQYIDAEYASYRKFAISTGWINSTSYRITQDYAELAIIDTTTPFRYGWAHFAKIHLINSELVKLDQPLMTEKEINYLIAIKKTSPAMPSAEEIQRLAGFKVEKHITVLTNEFNRVMDND